MSNISIAKGFGPTFSKGTLITDGTPAVVVFFQCVTTAIGPKAKLALNMSDFTRDAKYPRQVFWTQGVSLCVLVTLCGILGVTVTSASQQIYGVTTWNPLKSLFSGIIKQLSPSPCTGCSLSLGPTFPPTQSLSPMTFLSSLSLRSM
jgi:cytosine/uracil/thiamine/allantoin permease